MARRKRKKPAPAPLVGALAVGNDPDGAPRGSEAFGGSDADHPLRGALVVGNDPQGAPRGSESVGGSDVDEPLRGALLFGNDPKGDPRGSEAIGGTEADIPLKGALLFGNAPDGSARGSDFFGTPDAILRFRGAQAFGAAQLAPERIDRDDIGYDFNGVILVRDESTLAGVRKAPMDGLRRRVLGVLKRLLDIDADLLRHGLDEHAIKWGRLKNSDELDRELAETMRRWYKIAPGERLGIGHVRDLLEENHRMHTFDLACDWDTSPLALVVLWGGEAIARATSMIHNEHAYYAFVDESGTPLGFLDALVPRHAGQSARIRAPDGGHVASVVLSEPSAEEAVESKKRVALKAEVRGGNDDVLFLIEEQLVGPARFRALIKLPGSEEVVGLIEDTLEEHKIRTHVELDLSVAQTLAWAVGILLADLARLRRAGWPDTKPEPETSIESVDDALGPPGANKGSH